MTAEAGRAGESDAAARTRAAIVTAARTLFAERGYRATTVRDVAELAGCSPALIIKTMGSKAALFAAADPAGPDRDHHPGDGSAAAMLVRRIVARRDTGETDPWAMAAFLIQDAPDPQAEQGDTRGKYVRYVAGLIGDPDDPHALRRAEYAVCTLAGLATGIRMFGVLADEPSDALVALYTPIVQAALDAPPADPGG